jgi:hypothetical protein
MTKISRMTLCVFLACVLAATSAAGVAATAETSTAECDDGVDNNADGLTDMEDPQCSSPEDDSEGHGDPIEAHWNRSVALRFSEWKRDRLVAFGRVALPDGGPRECVAAMPVEIARRVDGDWVEVERTTTNGEGWYVTVLPDRTGRYRAIAPRRRPASDDAGVCRRATRVKPHLHGTR